MFDNFSNQGDCRNISPQSSLQVSYYISIEFGTALPSVGKPVFHCPSVHNAFQNLPLSYCLSNLIHNLYSFSFSRLKMFTHLASILFTSLRFFLLLEKILLIMEVSNLNFNVRPISEEHLETQITIINSVLPLHIGDN